MASHSDTTKLTELDVRDRGTAPTAQRGVERYTRLRGHALGMSPKELAGLERVMGERVRDDAERADATLRRVAAELHEALQAWGQADAAARAAFRFKHSKELAGLAYAEPRTLLQFTLDELRPEHEFGWTPAQLDEAKFWIEFEARLRQRVIAVHFGPVIYSAPDPLAVGSEGTLIGARLGVTAGTVTLVDCTGNQHPLTVLEWSETAVRVRAPAAITGIPFGCEGRLDVTLADGQVTSIRVGIEPLTRLMVSVDAFSDSGGAVFSTFSQNRDFRSAPLPASFREFAIPPGLAELTAGSVLFKVSNVLLPVFDGGVHVTIISGPAVNGSSLLVSTRLTDDHAWNFTVRAEFFILVPNGIVAPGWS